jgi:hypothetical protein
MIPNNGNIKKWLHSDWNVICDVCGRKRKRSQCVLAYASGDIAVIMSCIDGCADYRHPLNSPPPLIFDAQPVPDARPQQTSVFVTPLLMPSGFTFGHFPGGTFGNFNMGNSNFSFNLPWTWGAFVGTDINGR